MSNPSLLDDDSSHAKKLYTDFSGHLAKHQWSIGNGFIPDLGVFGSQIPVGTFTLIGQADFLLVINKGVEKKLWLKDGAPLLISQDRKKLVIPSTYSHKQFFSNGVVKLKEIGYTAKRLGKSISYAHPFKLSARPQLQYNSTRQFFQSLGGDFEFTARGFVDR